MATTLAEAFADYYAKQETSDATPTHPRTSVKPLSLGEAAERTWYGKTPPQDAA